MTKQTKLVDCGCTVFTYDFNTPRYGNRELNFETIHPTGKITNLQRLLLTNFVDDRLLTNFILTMPLHEYKNASSRLRAFINQLEKSCGCSNIQYLAVSELPTRENGNITINLATNLELDALMHATFLYDDISGDSVDIDDDEYEGRNEEEYVAKLWGDVVFIEPVSKYQLLTTFTSAYNKSITSDLYDGSIKIIFKSRLRQPNILWNEEADDFIKSHNLLDYPNHKSNEVFDKVGGFMIVNEYSLYNILPVLQTNGACVTFNNNAVLP